jgi:hypothetical protein
MNLSIINTQRNNFIKQKKNLFILKKMQRNKKLIKQLRNKKQLKTESQLRKQIYDIIYLEPIKKINMSNTLKKTINDNEYCFFTSNPCIINHPYEKGKYIMNIRWSNYKLNENGNVILNYPLTISLNSYLILDNLFNKIGEEYFLDSVENYNNPYVGIEDARIFKYSNKLYYIGSAFNENTNTIAITSNEYILNTNNTKFQMNKTIIIPSFYDYIRVEKNWCFVEYNKQMCFIYNWYPLTICQIDNNNKLNILETKDIKDEFFKNVKGSTSGVLFNNEIWFILHKTINNDYLHFFAVFDVNMNLLRYSNLFKLNKCKIEYCIGLIINNDTTILSFSSLDTSIFIGIYDNKYINYYLKWVLYS